MPMTRRAILRVPTPDTETGHHISHIICRLITSRIPARQSRGLRKMRVYPSRRRGIGRLQNLQELHQDIRVINVPYKVRSVP